MSTQHNALPDIASLAHSLRQQVAESLSPQTSKGRRKAPPHSSAKDSALHDNLLALLELIDELEEAPFCASAGIPSSTQAQPTSSTGPTPEQILATLDGGMAQWQSKITLAYSQNASQELADHLKLAKRLTDSLNSREERLESQGQQLEQKLTELLQRSARTERQRTAIAKTLRAQKAEMLLELEMIQTEQEGLIRQELLSEMGCTHSDNQEELEFLRCELAAAIERLRELEGNQETQTDDNSKRVQELEEQLAQADRELTELRERLQSNPETPLLVQAQADTIAELKEQLELAEQQQHELRDQNSDLAAQVAKHQVLSSGHTPHVSFQQESLSWEERKKLIMQQLEGETDTADSSSDEQIERQLAIEQVLLTTQSEIEKRDREIAELQAIIEQQSDTRQGVAIGAAAFAQAFDNDEMIQQERSKLKDIQREWEEKLRQAEVDVSLERAKLARERLQLEQELQSTQRERSANAKEPETAKKRKWLEHLGLRDENRGDK